MTAADKPAFAKAFARLNVAFREKQTDAATMFVYFDGLDDREIEFVVAAAERLVRSPWFPKVSEWHAEACKVEAERVEAQRALLRKLPTPLCAACSDTGWAINDADHRAVRCGCSAQRRLEVLGRQPWPALPAAPQDTPNDAPKRGEAASVLKMIERRTGRTIAPRAIPHAPLTGTEIDG